MLLAAGVRLGVYEIQSAIGVGGMGEVYRARDTRLHRDVALKILPEAFAADPDRLARFEREAQVLAALNHPNIAAIYGIEEASTVRALVLELVEGPTLADRIAAGAVGLEEALTIARQIAEALGAAHERGIVHRDLKPANIKVRPDSAVKVLDFGLAKTEAGAGSTAGGDTESSHSPTVTTPAVTRAGVILGTAAYMSPEQAVGKHADPQSDIWAFGLVLFEMLTGRRGFAGDTTVEVLSNVLKAEPDWTALPPAAPPAIRSLLRRCLQKDPTRRLHDIADARFQIEEALNEPAAIGTIAPAPMRIRTRLPWVAAMIAAIAASAGGALWYVGWSQVEGNETRLDITAPPTTDLVSLAISPDGRQVAFVATFDGQSMLWVRSLDSISARPLAGTENASLPFWSPDSRSVGFSANQQLKRVDVDKGTVQTLAAGGDLGGAWNSDGTILFSGSASQPLFRVSANGGERTAVTEVNAQTANHRLPQFLPDQRHFLFFATGAAAGIYVGEIGTGDAPRRILDDAQAATYASSGHLLFVRQGTLFAQAFDAVRLELSGNPVTVADRIVLGAGSGLAALSASTAGPIVYRTGGSGAPRELAWFDRSGKELGKVAGSAAVGRTSLSLSSDGLLVAFEQTVSGGTTTDISLLDLRRGGPSRFTFDGAFDLYPILSRNGRRIAFASNRKGSFDVYAKPATGTESEDLFVGGQVSQIPQDWSPNGRFLLYTSGTLSNRDILAFPLDGDRAAFPIVQTPFDELNGQFSPDSKWIAYQSNESGRAEIYVQLFPDPGPAGKSRISKDGGMQVRWRQDGEELFYLGPDNQFMAVTIRLDAPRGTVDVGTPRKLFTARLPTPTGAWQYDASRDGQRFLVDALQEITLPITVVLNWKP